MNMEDIVKKLTAVLHGVRYRWHKPGAWVAGHVARDTLRLLPSEYVSAPRAATLPETLLGLALEMDRGLPPDLIELRDTAGKVIGRVENVT